MAFKHLINRQLTSLLIFGLLVTNAFADDAYLRGYLGGILEQKLNWETNEYDIKVKDSVATIIYKNKSTENIDNAKEIFARVPLLVDFNFIEENDASTGLLPSYIHFPQRDYFKPLIANVKEPQFFVTFAQAQDDQNDILVGLVGLGQNFGLYRWPSSSSGDGWQLSFFAGLFSQFNMDSPSDDLLNSDYLVGLPLSFRYGQFSGRFRLFHQSSHLGDELLLSGNAPERINLSIEAIDALLAYDIGYWTGMIGFTKIISHNPSDIEEHVITAGINYRNPTPVLGNSRFIAGISTTWIEDVNWNSGTSFKAGLEIGQSHPRRYGTRIMFEAYKGLSPFGQFYTSDVEYYGAGIYFDFN
ncbi:MAG TPA: DUF1207 domain-containing protein [Gammaproteobacteria bacterium]